jgi:hypothetical protein
MSSKEQIFNSYDEAHKHSLTVPWKLETCNVGESCWCRIILPTEKILYKDKVGDTDRISEFEYIIPDGSIDKETAEYFLELHNDKLKENKRVIKSQSFPIPTYIQDAMANAIREASKK